LRLSLTIDDSKDDEIRIKDLSNIEVDDWRRDVENEREESDTKKLIMNEAMNEMNGNDEEKEYEYVLKAEMRKTATRKMNENRNSESEMK
jgi:hypothetical protein